MSVVLDRLEQFDTDFEYINEFVHENTIGIIAYTSHLEGLGTKHSDIDLYALCEKLPEDECYKKCDNYLVSNVIVNGLELDIEYWRIDDIYNLIDNLVSIDNQVLAHEKYKLLYRMLIGEILVGNEEISKLRTRISNSDMIKRLINSYRIRANSEYLDAVKLYKNDEFDGAIICIAQALIYSMMAYLGTKDVIVMNMKWLPRLMSKIDDDYTKEFVQHFSFNLQDEETKKSQVASKLRYIQNLLVGAFSVEEKMNG